MHKATSPTITVIAILLGLIWLFSLCLSSVLPMRITRGNIDQVAGCALAHTSTLCPATAAQHLQVWQQLTVTPSPTFALLALLFAVVAFSLKHVIIGSLHTATVRLRYRVWQMLLEPALPFGDYLKQAFSQGILHPKIY